MNDEQRKLLLDHKAFVLPKGIEHDTIVDILLALKEGREKWPDSPLSLYCSGDGGSVDAAFAITALIQEDGNIDGYLLGVAYSAHSVIWSGCATRYIYPGSSLGIHRISIDTSNQRIDGPTAQALLHELEGGTNYAASIYAMASNKPAAWWIAKMDAARNRMSIVDADEIIALGMAERIGGSPVPLNMTATLAVEWVSADGQ